MTGEASSHGVGGVREPTECNAAVVLANVILNRTHADPDDDLSVLARQFLRALEREGAAKRCLGFFASVIKSGEPWTATCQREYDLVSSPNETDLSNLTRATTGGAG